MSDPERARLRWRCRRGMRELDALMTHWLDRHYANADDRQRKLFSAVLDLQDPEIMDLIKAETDGTESDNAGARAGSFRQTETITKTSALQGRASASQNTPAGEKTFSDKHAELREIIAQICATPQTPK